MPSRAARLGALLVVACATGGAASQVPPAPAAGAPRETRSSWTVVRSWDEPPPRLVVPSGSTVATLSATLADWRAIQRDWSVPVPAQPRWHAVSSPSGPEAPVVLGTARVPVRVVVRSFRSVGPDGVPDETGAREWVCGTDALSGLSPCPLRVESGGIALDISKEVGDLPYRVVQAAWVVPVAEGGLAEVSASWIWRVAPPPDMPERP